MSDLYNIGTSALLSLQQSLSTTGNNIANVGTPGYSRQTANTVALPTQGAGRIAIGSGVTIDSVTRTHDNFVAAEVVRYSSSNGQLQAYSELALRLDYLLSESGGAFNDSLRQFFGSMNDLAANPSSTVERELVISSAGNLEASQQGLVDGLRGMYREVNTRLQTSVDSVNQLADSLASLNASIVGASGSGYVKPDLLDQRDNLLKEMAALVDVRTVEAENGALNVFIGNGQGLVVGADSRHLDTEPNAYDGTRLDVSLQGSPPGTVLNGALKGGELGGLLEFRAGLLDNALADLGLVSTGLAETFNAQHALGMDLNGNPGGDFFGTSGFAAQANGFNSQTDQPLVSISDVSQLVADSYELVFDGSNWQLNGQTSGVGLLSLDGLEVDTTTIAAPQAGDRYLVAPMRQGAENFTVELTNPNSIAAASPLTVTNELANLGDTRVAEVTVNDIAALPLPATVQLTFAADADGAGNPGFVVAGMPSAPLLYDPATEAAGKQLSFAAGALSIELSGTPQPGDIITLGNATANSTDNGNALALTALQGAELLENGSSSFADVYSTMVGTVALKASGAEAGLAVESSMLDQAVAYQSRVSGVNLEEEAAELMRLQQQYQAAAQLISAADMIFATLLSATQAR